MLEAVAAPGVLGGAVICGWWLSRVRTWRFLILVIGCAVTLASPWLIAPSLWGARFVCAGVAVLLCMRMTECALHRTADRRGLAGLGSFLLYFLTPHEICFERVGAVRRWRESAATAVRALVKATGLVGLLGLAATQRGSYQVGVLPDLPPTIRWLADSLWCLLFLYCLATGIADIIRATLLSCSGYEVQEIFNRPLAARAPGDFWGARWNLTFRNASHRLLFVPVARRSGVSVALTAVFIWSALAHEYLVVASLGRPTGQMFMFFIIQGIAVAVLRRMPRRVRLPKLPSVSSHWLWMVLTAPLFMAPVKEVFFLQFLLEEARSVVQPLRGELALRTPAPFFPRSHHLD